MPTAVYVKVKKTNRDAVRLADNARRQLNYLGPVGFKIMTGMTDDLFRRVGYHRFVFSSRSLAIKFQDMVSENCDRSVYTERYQTIPTSARRSTKGKVSR